MVRLESLLSYVFIYGVKLSVFLKLFFEIVD